MNEKASGPAGGDQPPDSAVPHATGKKLRPCPICGKPATSEMQPFCSKRCADVDLHRWLGGTYAIPVVEEDGAEREQEPDKEL